jgi:hypothetical protein
MLDGATVSGMTTTTTTAAPMSRRSWYLPSDIADDLARAVDDLHWRLRIPKHEVLSAAVAFALEHRADIEARLAGPGRPPAPASSNGGTR